MTDLTIDSNLDNHKFCFRVKGDREFLHLQGRGSERHAFEGEA